MEIDGGVEQSDVFAVIPLFVLIYFMRNIPQTYLADHAESEAAEPVFNEELGLVIGKLKEGFEISDLWNVLPKK